MIVVACDPGLVAGAILAVDADATLLHEFEVGAPQRNLKKFAPLTYATRLETLAQQVKKAWATIMHDLGVAVINEGLVEVPDIAVTIEQPLIGRSAQSSLKLFGAYAVMLHTFHNLAPNPDLVRPINNQTIKKFVGCSQKAFIAREVWKRWRYNGKTHHLCDAYAMARYTLDHPTGWDEEGAKKRKFKRALRANEAGARLEKIR